MLNATAQNEALFNSAFMTGVLYAAANPAQAAIAGRAARTAHASTRHISTDVLGLTAQDTADLYAIFNRASGEIR